MAVPNASNTMIKRDSHGFLSDCNELAIIDLNLRQKYIQHTDKVLDNGKNRRS